LKQSVGVTARNPQVAPLPSCIVRGYAAAGNVLAVIVMLACAGCGKTAFASTTMQTRSQEKPVKTGVPARPTAHSQAAKPLNTQMRAAKPESAYRELSAAIAGPIRQDGGNVAVAVDDLSTGVASSYNGSKEFITASIVKVDILSTLLYQSQQAGQATSGEEQQLAAAMIENSDNDSASDLYYDVSGSAGIDSANSVFGLSETTAGTDGYWGLTTTTADDQLRLLRLVFTSDSALSSASRSYIQGLMGNVETDQQWGVSAAADAGTSYMLKNGWLPDPDLWEINSIGEVTHNGERMLIAVLSDDNATEDSGISIVEAVAAKAADAIAAADAGRLAPLSQRRGRQPWLV
jgi:hypothetical protein